eukprot:5443917-Prymnesium_polylepis.1
MPTNPTLATVAYGAPRCYARGRAETQARQHPQQRRPGTLRAHDHGRDAERRPKRLRRQRAMPAVPLCVPRGMERVRPADEGGAREAGQDVACGRDVALEGGARPSVPCRKRSRNLRQRDRP